MILIFLPDIAKNDFNPSGKFFFYGRHHRLHLAAGHAFQRTKLDKGNFCQGCIAFMTAVCGVFVSSCFLAQARKKLLIINSKNIALLIDL